MKLSRISRVIRTILVEDSDKAEDLPLPQEVEEVSTLTIS
jgi:hypothetical protein